MKFIGSSTVKNMIEQKSDDPSVLSEEILKLKKSIRFKKYNHIRLSEIDTFCPREYSIGYHLQSTKKYFIDYPMQQQFDLGTAIHWWFQNKSKAVDVYGFYKCLACKNPVMADSQNRFFGFKPKFKCSMCGADSGAFEYDEFYFRIDSPYRVTGKIDGVLNVDGKYHLVDFKSYWEIPKTGFPEGKDAVQLSAYSYFYNFVPESLKFPVEIDNSVSYLIYISKKFSYKESLLTFKVPYSDALVKGMVDRVSSFTKSVTDRSLPDPFESCIRGKFLEKRSKDCFVSANCKEFYRKGVTIA